MLRSMTGYGRASRKLNHLNLVIQIKSTNHRGLDIFVRAPKEWMQFEPNIYEFIRGRIYRGRIDVFMDIEYPEPETENLQIGRVKVNVALAREYYNALKELAEELQIPSTNITLSELADMPDVIEYNKFEKTDELTKIEWETILPVLEEATASLIKMREEEGRKLEVDILDRLNKIETDLNKIQILAPQAVEKHYQQLKNILNSLTGEPSESFLKDERITKEIALYASQCDISEELIRLGSHINQFKETLNKSNEPQGRRLDFIIQELFREISTVGAKANHAEIGILVVDIKTELEKIRQQVQNIE